jgi:3-(3-hydroxy-phenyl)propionate hydroxylase
MAYGAKSTEFMAPPDFAYALMREATLRLARNDASVRALINPRQSTPVSYAQSPLNLAEGAAPWASDLAAPGQPAPEAEMPQGRHLTHSFGAGFVCLVFGADDPPDLSPLADLSALGIALLPVPPSCAQAWQRYGLGAGVDGVALRKAIADSGVWL